MKKLLPILVLTALAIGIFAYRQYNKPHADMASAAPVAKLSASALFNAYSANEKLANKKYTGKVVEVTGNVADVETGKDGAVTVVLMNDNTVFGVLCGFGPGTVDPQQISAGERLTIRGKCAGMLSDVILNRCIIIEKNDENR